MLRIIRFRLEPAQVPALDAFVREHAIPVVRDQGMLAALIGRRTAEDGVSYAVVSRYPGFDALQRIIGDDLERARFLGDWAPRLEEPEAEHFEAMDLDPPVQDAREQPTLMRIYTGQVVEADAPEYYDFIRRTAWPVIRERAGLKRALFGRRVDEGRHAFAFVTAWSATAGPDVREPAALRGSPQVIDERVEIYDLVTAFAAGEDGTPSG